MTEVIQHYIDGRVVEGASGDRGDGGTLTLDHQVTPSTLNRLGIKGVGEAGSIPVGPLFAQAVEDALELPSKGVDILEIPLSPNRLWELARS